MSNAPLIKAAWVQYVQAHGPTMVDCTFEKWHHCRVILPGYWIIPGYLTKNTRAFFSTPVLWCHITGVLTNTRVFSIKYPGIWQPVKYPGKWQLMTAKTTCGLFRRISGVLSFTDYSWSSSLMLVIFIQLFLS